MPRKALTVAAAAAAARRPSSWPRPPAFAAARDGVCNSGEFCYYYNSGEAGSISDFTASIADYGTTEPSCYDFKGAGAGKGMCVKNNAASVWNRTSKTVRVYFNSGYGGAHQDFAAGAKGNLNATLKNNNASHHIGPIAPRGLTPRKRLRRRRATAARRHDCPAFADVPHRRAARHLRRLRATSYGLRTAGYARHSWDRRPPACVDRRSTASSNDARRTASTSRSTTSIEVRPRRGHVNKTYHPTARSTSRNTTGTTRSAATARVRTCT